MREGEKRGGEGKEKLIYCYGSRLSESSRDLSEIIQPASHREKTLSSVLLEGLLAPFSPVSWLLKAQCTAGG